jgi:hypothetical protein
MRREARVENRPSPLSNESSDTRFDSLKVQVIPGISFKIIRSIRPDHFTRNRQSRSRFASHPARFRRRHTDREQCADKKDSHQRTQALKPPARRGPGDHLRGRGRDEIAWLVEMTGVGDSFYSRSSVTFTSHW